MFSKFECTLHKLVDKYSLEIPPKAERNQSIKQQLYVKLVNMCIENGARLEPKTSMTAKLSWYFL